MSHLPSREDIVCYFRWRAEDAHRNALNAHWLLRESGRTAAGATEELHGTSVAEKNELLFDARINYNELPVWQKRGVGFFWEMYEKIGANPLTGERTTALRRRIAVQLEAAARRSGMGTSRWPCWTATIPRTRRVGFFS